ncbi:glycoside hydrolase family 16 protein [Aeromicrobium sp.]|uniref:glycoside hydrolase family 16 protein n=1 Tax=Aeromicrobium sp. TaxID=1871063 RepID=UPI0019A83570|nr:glycoside hydrolase family 16 protein [Aeromicrobium sp.]MBC7631384.1 glycoside hydrolase family 16 protein [Aeromicrobium sp.]
MIRQLTWRLALSAVALSVLAVSSLPVDVASARAAKPTGNQSCGPNIYKQDGQAWRCTFADDFSGSSLDTRKWFVQETANSGFGVGGECFVKSRNNVSVGGGSLRLTARREPNPFTCASPGASYTTQYTSGSVSTYGLFAQAYGRFEIRARFPAAKVAGLQSALWLWPANPSKYGAWPMSGEIDIAEEYSQYSDRVIPYIHYISTDLSAQHTNTACLINDVSAPHTYVAEWTASTITISYDGVTCLKHTISPAAPLTGSAPFDQPFIVALTQALGVGNNAFDPSSTPLPATTQVDYVHVWS